MSRTRRSTLSLITGLGGSAVTMAVGLVSTPLLLVWLGDSRVGTHRVLTEWLGYLALLDFGLGGTLQTVVARHLGQSQRATALADVRRAMRLLVGVGAVQLVATGLLAWAGPLLVAGLSDELVAEMRWGLAVACLGLFVAPLAALRPLLDGAQQSYWVNVALIGQYLSTVGVSLLLAWAGWGITGQFVAGLVGAGGYTLFLFALVYRRYPDLWRADPAATPDPFPVAWPMFVFNLVGKVSVLSDSIILGVTLGPEDVVRFAVTQRLMQVAMGQVMAIGNATWAALADLYHRGEMDTFRSRFSQLNRWTAVLGVATLGPLAILNERLVGLWVGTGRFGGDVLSWTTLVQCLLMAQISLWAWPLVGSGKIRRVLPIILVGSTVNLLVSVLATTGFGVVGPVVGTVVSYLLVYYWWYPRLLRQSFGLSPRAVMLELPRSVACFVPFAVGMWGVANWLPTGVTGSRWLDFLVWAAVAVAGGLSYLVCVGGLLATPNERRWLVSKVRRCG